MWAYIRQLVGNGKVATIGIFVFIVILCLLFWRSGHAAEVDLRAGSSFGTEGTGPVIGFHFRQPLNDQQLYVFAGTDLWGSTIYRDATVPNNWDWNVGLETCRWRICGSIGADFLQRIDAINGAHTDYMLGLSYQISDRWAVALFHISDAGTTNVNIGRQAITVSYRLQ